MSWINLEIAIVEDYADIASFVGWSKDSDEGPVATFQTHSGEDIIISRPTFEQIDTRLNIGAMSDRPVHTRLSAVFKSARPITEKVLSETERHSLAADRALVKYFAPFI